MLFVCLFDFLLCQNSSESKTPFLLGRHQSERRFLMVKSCQHFGFVPFSQCLHWVLTFHVNLFGVIAKQKKTKPQQAYRTPRTPRAMATGDGPSTAALLAFATAICTTETEMVSRGGLEGRIMDIQESKPASRHNDLGKTLWCMCYTKGCILPFLNSKYWKNWPLQSPFWPGFWKSQRWHRGQRISLDFPYKYSILSFEVRLQIRRCNSFAGTNTLPKTNKEPENTPLEKEKHLHTNTNYASFWFPFGFRGCIPECRGLIENFIAIDSLSQKCKWFRRGPGCLGNFPTNQWYEVILISRQAKQANWQVSRLIHKRCWISNFWRTYSPLFWRVSKALNATRHYFHPGFMLKDEMKQQSSILFFAVTYFNCHCYSSWQCRKRYILLHPWNK